MAVDDLIKLLSTAFRKDADSNNYKLLEVIDSEFQNIEQTINDIKYTHSIDLATGKSLDWFASLFNVRRKQNETDDHFRARIKLAFSKIADMATINDIKEIVAATLQTKTSRIRVVDKWNVEPAYFDVWVWLQDLNNVGLTVEELKDLLQAIKPAGVRLDAKQFGTFTYRSASETSDLSKAYSGTFIGFGIGGYGSNRYGGDNTNPDGGTYAGLL